ncbi:hypothetical protein TWF481_002468 [Arthrobotrys musiformis]|uniref:Uncharacterized protein n=1 Tax=Arthrobotrys musiformis TaxID=47236 RepID=A0AAV9VZD6_9PEZI
MSSPPSTLDQLDLLDEPSLEELQQQIHDLTKLRNAHQTALLALRSTRSLKDHLSSSAPSTITTSLPSLQISDKNLNAILLARSAEISKDHQEWTQEALYRMTGLTKFSIADPSSSFNREETDNNGDKNKITGIRIEVMADGKFGTPYYLFLKPHDATPKPTPENPSPSPVPSETHLDLHRHTIPAYFIQELNLLAEKHLPPPPKPQNLDRFARDVRSFLVLHYLRRAKLLHVQNAVKESLKSNSRTPEDIYVSEFTIDPEVRLVEIQWADNTDGSKKRHAWIALTQEGGIEGLIVKENNERILQMEMQIKGADWVRGATDSTDWIDGLFDRLKWSPSPI